MISNKQDKGISKDSLSVRYIDNDWEWSVHEVKNIYISNEEKDRSNEEKDRARMKKI